MNKLIKDLIQKEIDESYDNLYRAELELKKWTNISDERKKNLKEYVIYHENKIKELKKELEP